MSRFFSRFTEPTYAFLRVVAGLLFAFHGLQKIFGVLSDFRPPMGSQLWFGGVIEIVGGGLIAIGLFTTCAAFIASGQMAVAYVQFHWQFRFGKEFFPAINKGELALIYAVLFLFVCCRGAGVWSVDAMRAKRR